jgi:hypothetical protein
MNDLINTVIINNYIFNNIEYNIMMVTISLKDNKDIDLFNVLAHV